MKKLIFLLAIIFIAAGCKNEKVVKTRILGFFTPYNSYPEKLVGNVKSLVEKNYWAIPDGESFIKGAPITIKDRDSVSWTNDFEVEFDSDGHLVKCTIMDENNKILDKLEVIKQNNIRVSANYVSLDTLRAYVNLKLDEKGFMTEISQFRAQVDTLLNSCSFKYNIEGLTTEFQWFNYKKVPGNKGILTYDETGHFKRLDNYNKESVFTGAVEVVINDKGKMSELNFYNKKNEPTGYNHFTYEYDSIGNWTKAIVKDKSGKVFIEERVYTYFE